MKKAIPDPFINPYVDSKPIRTEIIESKETEYWTLLKDGSKYHMGPKKIEYYDGYELISYPEYRLQISEENWNRIEKERDEMRKRIMED